MFFASDNTAPVHPAIMAALARANDGHAMPYGAEEAATALRARIRSLFDAPRAEVFLVATGTAANSLLLASLCAPYQTVFCTPEAHINEDECNAPEFFTGGAKLSLVASQDAKMTPDSLRARIMAEGTRGVHGPARGPVSITNVTERGTVYTPAEVAALAEVAHEFSLPLHMDGARLANALAATGASPADMTWRAGVDALSLGATKCGAMGVEAAILFNPDEGQGWQFELRRKRGAQLFSKHRYLTAQMAAWLEGGLWLDLARHANEAMRALTAGLPADAFLHPAEANIAFIRLPRAVHRRLHAAGAQYYLWGDELDGGAPDDLLAARLVTGWATSDAEIRRFLDLLDG